MRKVKNGIYCYLTADILTKVLQQCSLSSPIPNIAFLSKPLSLVGCMATERLNLQKKNKTEKKTHLLRSHKGVKLKLQKCLYN